MGAEEPVAGGWAEEEEEGEGGGQPLVSSGMVM